MDVPVKESKANGAMEKSVRTWSGQFRTLKSHLEYEIKVEILGPEKGHKQEVRVLNRVLRWTAEGIAYEPDQRHGELVIKELGLEGGKAVTSPWTTAETP